MSEPIRVLQVLGGTGLGGAESRVMDLYRHIDREKVQFDFAVHTDKPGFFDPEIRQLGGHIYSLPRFRGYNLLAYRKAWRAFFAAHPNYQCVHGHMTSTASIYLPIAKKAGVPVTAAHARSAGVDGGLKGMLTRILRKPLWKRTDYCLAASALAGEAVFGKKAMAQGLVQVLPNAIAAEKYGYDEKMREQMRKQLGIGKDCFAVGHVGRFHPCKNHDFMLEVFCRICKEQENSVLLFLGEGERMDAAKARARELGIADKVLFLGNQAKVADYYQAMDFFLFPSSYEGLPGTVLEAQAAGLPCLLSDTLTKEVAVTPLVEYMSLKEPPESWAKKILAQAKAGELRHDRLRELRDSGFDVKTQAAFMQAFYETGELS